MFGTVSNMSVLGLGPAMTAVFAVARENDSSPPGSKNRSPENRAARKRTEPRSIWVRRRLAAWCDHLAVNLFRVAIRLEPTAIGPAPGKGVHFTAEAYDSDDSIG